VNLTAAALLVLRDAIAAREPGPGVRWSPESSRRLDELGEAEERLADAVIREPVETNLETGRPT